MIGRSGELESVLARMVPAEGRTVVVLGEAGAGKTTLLSVLRERAEEQGFRVLRVCGNRAETPVAFAVLADLVRGVARWIPELPGPQREAIGRLLGVTRGVEGADALGLRLATLTLVTEAARERPLLVLIDDAHWIDHASRSVIGFVLRRLDGDPVSAVVAARGRVVPDGFERAEVVEVPPLGETDARVLLSERFPSLGGAAELVVLREADGNPLALVELGRVAAADPRAVAIFDGLPPVERLEAVFAADLTQLPVPTKHLLALVAAGADDLGTLAAAAGDPFDPGALTSAESSGIVVVNNGDISFRHPVARRAAYRSAPAEVLREAHLRLARVFAGDPDRRVWQVAAAAAAPDESVARELEAYADRAKAQGATVEAARALERAVRFTVAGPDRARRLLEAAGQAGASGHFSWVEQLAVQVRSNTTDPQMLTLADHHLATALARAGLQRAASETLVRVVEDAAAVDPTIGWAALSVQATLVYECNGDRDLLRSGLARLLAAEDPAQPMMPPELSAPVRLWVEAAIDPLDRSGGRIEQLGEHLPAAAAVPSAIRCNRELLLGAAALLLDEAHVAATRLGAAVELMRRTQSLGDSGGALSGLGCAYLDLGRLDDVERTALELHQVATIESKQYLARAADHLLARAAALRGDVSTARRLAEDTLVGLDPRDWSALAGWLHLTLGHCSWHDGDNAAAYTHLRRLYDEDGGPAHYHVSPLAIADLARAAALSGQVDDARAIVTLTRSATGNRRATRLDLLVHHAEAVLADGQVEAERHWRLAVVNPAGEQWPLERARARLGYGEWLRRHRRPTDARPLLHAAAAAFDAMGASVWSRRAHHELRAAGVATEAPSPGPLAQLSTQQQQIVRLAAEGLSNREIGDRLYLSPRTVGSHLYRVFPKLGVAARHQLRPLLEAAEASTPAR